MAKSSGSRTSRGSSESKTEGRKRSSRRSEEAKHVTKVTTDHDEIRRWAEERGAKTAYLQVERDNASALALYAGFGFTAAYGYHYRECLPTKGR